MPRARWLFVYILLAVTYAIAPVCAQEQQGQSTNTQNTEGWLKDAADAAGALSLIVAAATLYFSYRSERTRKLREEVTNWQRVVVYRTIAKGKTDFEEIKQAYLGEAQQLAGLELGKEQIQDNALMLVLMSLLESKLISLAAENRYLLTVASEGENQWREIFGQEAIYRQKAIELRARLLAILETESGKYTIETMHRSEKIEELGLKFDAYNALVRELIERGSIDLVGDRLHLGAPRFGGERIVTRTVVNPPAGGPRFVRPGAPPPSTQVAGDFNPDAEEGKSS
jgi:hypothetical protein